MSAFTNLSMSKYDSISGSGSGNGPEQKGGNYPDAGGGSDEACARLARQGSHSALSELVRRYTPGLFHLFNRLYTDRELARDDTQEVFLRIHKNISRYDPDRSFKTWIYTIAWNLARDRFRKRRRGGGAKIVSLDSFRNLSGDETSLDPLDSRELSPDQTLAGKEDVTWVHRGLDSLRPDQKAIISLREYENLSYDDLAKLLGCKVGTVKSRLNRARLELKDALLSLRPDWVETRYFRRRPRPSEDTDR